MEIKSEVNKMEVILKLDSEKQSELMSEKMEKL